jgi:hypothetical protein
VGASSLRLLQAQSRPHDEALGQWLIREKDAEEKEKMSIIQEYTNIEQEGKDRKLRICPAPVLIVNPA